MLPKATGYVPLNLTFPPPMPMGPVVDCKKQLSTDVILIKKSKELRTH
jgi:hypothetical protein